MPIKGSLTADFLSEEQFDRVARECQSDIARLPGIDLGVVEGSSVSSPGDRGDPITLGAFALALVTS